MKTENSAYVYRAELMVTHPDGKFSASFAYMKPTVSEIISDIKETLNFWLKSDCGTIYSLTIKPKNNE